MSGLTISIDFYNDEIMKSKDAVTALAALGHESRLAVFRMLVRRGPQGFSPTQLIEKLGIPAPTLSFHLKELSRAGLIEVRREGRSLFYSANFAHMNLLIEFLTENCCTLEDKAIDGSDGPPGTAACAPSVAPKRKRA